MTASAPILSESSRASERYCVLVVDDEPDLRSLYQTALERVQFEVVCAATVAQAKQLLADRTDIACVVCDYRLPDGTGMDVLAHIGSLTTFERPPLPISIMTAYGSPEHSVQALKAGAYDYLTKPIAIADLRQVVGKMLAHSRNIEGNKPQAALELIAGRLPSQSTVMQSVHEQLAQLAHTAASVVLLGESGVGKELAAKALHLAGQRSKQAFVVVNCGTLDKANIEQHLFGEIVQDDDAPDLQTLKAGAFQQAQGGTLLLDEVGTLPLDMQVRLLTALQERSITPIGASTPTAIDVRILAASAQHLTQLVASGAFRQDLYYRLNVVAIHLPALRDRQGDALWLAQRWLAAHAEGKGLSLSKAAQGWLGKHPFNGNIRELNNMLERGVAIANAQGLTQLEPAHLQARESLAPSHSVLAAPLAHATSSASPDIKLPIDLTAHLAAIERQLIEQALQQTRYNRSKAGDLLGLNLRQLRYRIEQLGIDC